MSQEENKRIVQAFYQTVLNDRDVDTAFRLYASNYYRQHNPLVEDGKEGVRKFVAWIGANRPNARGEIKRVFAEGEFVILHVHWTGLLGGKNGEAVVDIFRLEDGKIVEHWDVIQLIPDTASNDNTMF